MSSSENTNREYFDLVMDRLRAVLSLKNDAEMAEVLGLKPNAYANRKRNASVPYEEIVSVAAERGLNLDAIFLSGDSQNVVREPPAVFAITKNDQVTVPRYDVKGSSGPGSQVDADRIVEHITFSQTFIRDVLRVPAKYLAIIEVSGHSMEPTLSDGEQVMVDLRQNRFIDDAVYVIQQDGHLRIKRVQMRMDGTILIKSDSVFYDDEVLQREDADRLRVIGTVLPYKFGKYKL